jgi:hypothetical protein
MFIMMTDHGNRLKFYSYATEQGKLERYNPFVSIRLPRVLRNTRYFYNAFENQKKLLSFHDLHQTLRQYLHISENGLDYVCNKMNKFNANRPNDRNKRGVSMLESVPTNRTCQDALVPSMCCGCFSSSRQNITTEEELRNVTGVYDMKFEMVGATIVEKVNEILNKSRENNKNCARMKLDRVVSLQKIDMGINRIIYWNCVVVMQPGEAWFEAHLSFQNISSFKNGKRNYWSMAKHYKQIVRLSAYGEQSNCVKKDSALINFCFCNP